MSSSGGTVLRHGSRSIGPSDYDTGSSWKNLAPSTINVRLAAVRRLAYEASDSGLLSPELAAGIRRVKGAKRLGTRIGNWLTADQCRSLLRSPSRDTLRGKRDRAILSVLIGCGLRRHLREHKVAEPELLFEVVTCRFGDRGGSHSGHGTSLLIRRTDFLPDARFRPPFRRGWRRLRCSRPGRASNTPNDSGRRRRREGCGGAAGRSRRPFRRHAP